MTKKTNYIDEGYIKFNCLQVENTVPTHPEMEALKYWRRKMYEMQWIGFDPHNKVGFGNISINAEDQFIISGTQTGHLPELENRDFTKIEKYDVEQNTIYYNGTVAASSETLTHAVIHEEAEGDSAVIHIHNKPLWEKLLNAVPTSRSDVPYGTPEMANEIRRLFQEENLGIIKIMAMAGHEDGVIAFGSNLKEAAEVLYKHA